MKKLGKIKLNQLSKVELEKRALKFFVGGNCCGCGCNGPSSDFDNLNANYKSNYTQSYGGENYCSCGEDAAYGTKIN